MNTIVQAGAEELIWIVVGIFWVIAQIAGGAAKKKRASSRPPPENEGGGKAPEDPFADLMRKLAGVQEIKAPDLPRSELRSATGAPPKTVDAVRTPHLREEIPVPKPAPTPKPIPKPVEVAEVDIRPTMSSFRSVMPAMKLPAMKLSFQPSGKSTEISPILGNIINPADKSTLRRAMLSHVVLGKPRGLDHWSPGTVE